MFRRRAKSGEPPPTVPSPGVALRASALSVDPSSIGLTPSADAPVWGVVMDTSFSDSDGWHSLVALSDGTTSLYTSGAFGIIGGGAHETVRTVNAALIALTRDQLGLFSPASGTDLPPGGMVTIRALTLDGQRVVTAAEDDLGNSRHPASPIFHAAHNVIGRLRMITGPESAS